MKSNGKKQTIMIVIMIILLIVICVLVGYILYDKEIVFSKTSSDVKEVNTKKKEDVVEDKKDVVKELDLSKCLNTTGITYSNPNDFNTDIGMSMEINNDLKSITVKIDWSKFGPNSGATAWANSVENYSLTNFDKNIKSTFIGGLGQDVIGTTLFFLMDDGSVQYTPVFRRNSDGAGNTWYEVNYVNDNFVSNGSVNGVSEVIKLYNVSASDGFGWSTVIGAKKDGSFYDLGHIINQ